MAVFVWLTVILIILIGIVGFLQQQKKQGQIENGVLPKKIPGLEPSDPEEGNIPDIREAVTMSLFLKKLHKQFGPIACFWEGKQFCVSVASPEYLTQQRHLFDMPESINESVKILILDESLCAINGEEAKRRRQIYDQYLITEAFDFYSETFQNVAKEYISKWKQLDCEDCIPITRNALQASMKSILITSFGDTFNNDENVSQIQQKFDWVINHLENPVAPGSIEETTMIEYIKDLHGTVNRLLNDRREKNSDEKTVFADLLIRAGLTECQRVCDGVTFVYAGYETVGRLLIWAIYELCQHPEIQDKVYEEIKTTLHDEPITNSNVNKLTYLRQVINEVIRMRTSAEYTGRKNDEELRLGEYTIPRNTYIYHAMAVMAKDDDLWVAAEKFNPDRFVQEISQDRHPLLFKPFGFAGKRQCPGQKFALCQMAIFLASWFRIFQFSLVPGQTYQLNGIIPKIDDEVWVKVSRRSE